MPYRLDKKDWSMFKICSKVLFTNIKCTFWAWSTFTFNYTFNLEIETISKFSKRNWLSWDLIEASNWILPLGFLELGYFGLNERRGAFPAVILVIPASVFRHFDRLVNNHPSLFKTNLKFVYAYLGFEPVI